MRRIGSLAAAMVVAGLVGAGLAGCGLWDGRAGGPDAELAAALSPEAAALAAFGYDSDRLATADPAPGGWRHRRPARVMLREHLLHGEVVVETDDGTRTVLVQRGEVTATSDTTVTVTSTDGYAQTWTYGEDLRVVEARSTIEPQELAVGAEVAVAGQERDGTPVAGLILYR